MAESKEARNKALVLKAFDMLFNKRDYAAAERLWSPNYIQHSAHIEPGREGLIKDGILVEHWDVIQDEASREQSKSGLPMFGDASQTVSFENRNNATREFRHKTANETLILEPSRRLLLQKRSKDMRSEKAIMTSRREFLSNALGIALATASTWPIRADQARSMHGQSDSSTSNSGRTTQKISLRWDVFLAPSIPAITSDLPPGEKQRPWPPISSTLISGERDAVLVDTPITVEQARALANWVVASGKNPTTIYATHGHGDHFFGASAVLERFPGARFVARPDVIEIMRQQASPESLATFWNPRFPGQISSQLAIAEELSGNVINLEGHDLVSVPLGFTDTADTTCLHVPSIGLIVAGDAAYNGDHLHLSESPDQQKRQEWIAALDKMESLKPRAVIAGHKRVGNDDSPRVIGETRQYIRDFERLAMQTTTARELYDQMLKLYPDRINPGALWSSVRAVKT